jgi:hypothetical protein
VVKIGFIVEGPSDAMIIRSEQYNKLLTQLNLQFIDIVIPEGKTHFFHPKADFKFIEAKVSSYIQRLNDKGAEVICFIVDQDEEPCFTSVKEKIPFSNQHHVIICKRNLEAWYMADESMMSELLKSKYSCKDPESIIAPFEEIKKLMLEKTNRGIGDKIFLAKRVINAGFNIENAAKHNNCTSARYFLQKLQSICP